MISIRSADFDQFMAAFGVLRHAGVDVTASGGNDMTVPDDTSRDVLREVAAWGAVVDADLSQRDNEAITGAHAEPDTTDEPKPARRPRKTTRRTAKE